MDQHETSDRPQHPLEQTLYQIKKTIVGQDQLLERMIVALLARGHLLVEGVPGLAKTMAIKTLAQAIGGEFKRIQFTPDLVPADVTGTRIYNQRAGEFQVSLGPVFANLLLADEINRAPPKTQSALLEAMAERQVTVGSRRHPLPDPFYVLATQNPIEQEGTYPLPEAQLDRFMFLIPLDYPEPSDELEMLLRTTGDTIAAIEPRLHAADVIRYRHVVRRIAVSRPLAELALRLVRLTRPAADNPIESVRRGVAWGAGPRAGQFLLLAAKASAALRGSPLVTEDDLWRVVRPVAEHRIKTNFTAHAQGLTAAAVIDRVVDYVRGELDERTRRSGIGKLFRP